MTRLLEAWFALTIPPWAREAVRGDLDEEFADIAAHRGEGAARRWYLRESILVGLRYAGSRWRRAPQLAHDVASSGAARPLAGFGRDLRRAARRVRRQPAFAVTAIATLGIGIGINASIFSVVNAVLLKPLAREHPEHVVRLYARDAEGRRTATWNYAAYRRVAEPQASVTQVAAVHMAILAVRDGESRDQRLGEIASASYFDLLGAGVVVGRGLTSSDDRRSAEPVTVLSERYWRTRFDSAAAVLGRTLQLNGRPYTVVGVMDDAFRGSFAGGAVDFWLPLEPSLPLLGAGAAAPSAPPVLQLLARLQPGFTRAQAEGALASAAADLARMRGRPVGGGIDLVPGTLLHGSRRSMTVTFLAILMLLVGLVLLVAAANVANLMLARAIAGRRELAIRLALGAGRGRLVREFAAEGLVVAACGGFAGLLFAHAAGRAFEAVTLLPGFELRLALGPDWRVLLATAALTLAAGAIAAAGPIVSAWAGDLLPALKDGGASPGSVRSRRLRAALVVGQIAVASVACIAAGLLVKSGQAAAGADLGFETAGRFATDIDLTVRGYSEERARAFYRSLLEQVAAIPGVDATAVANRAPLDSSTPVLRAFRPAAHAGERFANDGVDVTFHAVSRAYFETIGLPMLTGRGFGAQDTASAPAVAIVNTTFAQRTWPGERPAAVIGRRFTTRGGGSGAEAEVRTVEVIGVAADAKYRTIGEEPQPHVYFPVEQRFTPDLAVLVKSASRRLPVLEVQAAIASLDSEVQGFFTRTFDEHTRVARLPSQLAASLAATVGLVSVLLGAIGLHGLIACIVAERRREFGLCLALGASPGRLSRQVLSRALRLAALGSAAGIGIALAATRLLRTLLYGVSPADPLVYGAVTGGVLAIAMLASWIPARRAMRGSVMDALRRS